MATEDPLNLLVATLSSKGEIQLLNDEAVQVFALKEATRLAFPNPTVLHGPRIVLSKTVPTRYRKPGSSANVADAATCFDVQSLLLCFLSRDQPMADYMREARSVGAAFVSAVNKREVLDYLEGRREAGTEVIPISAGAPVCLCFEGP